MSNANAHKSEINRGVMVFVALTILTLLEYWIATAMESTGALIAVAILKASVVLQHFMHIARVTTDEGGH